MKQVGLGRDSAARDAVPPCVSSHLPVFPRTFRCFLASHCSPPSPVALGVHDWKILAKETTDIDRQHALEARGSDGARAAERWASRVKVALAAAAHATGSSAADGFVHVRNALGAKINVTRSSRRRHGDYSATVRDGEVIEGEAGVVCGGRGKRGRAE
eukprot:scaffold2675_cov236-Pinguiococcus_pyrenoidosus.AAC.4